MEEAVWCCVCLKKEDVEGDFKQERIRSQTLMLCSKCAGNTERGGNVLEMDFYSHDRDDHQK